MASYLRILKMSPWWIKFQGRDEWEGISTDIRYRKPKAVEAALSNESVLPDGSDVGNKFLQDSIVTISDEPQGSANYNVDDEFNRICKDISILVDEEGAAKEYVEKLNAKPNGPTMTKYLKRCSLFWRDEPVTSDFYISAIEKIAKAEDNGLEYSCLSCGDVHDIENTTAFLKVIVGDSLLKHYFDGKIDGKDERHYDYLVKSGLRTATAVQEYQNLYIMERRPQLVFVVLGTNDIMEGIKAEKIKENMEDFVSLLAEMDMKHGRYGEKRSRIYFGGIPQSPRICHLPNMGTQPTNGEWLSAKAVNLMQHNKNIEALMKEHYPTFGTPSFHKVGWKSRKINKSGRRFYQMERREWRPHELPKPLHWSDSEKARVLRVIRKFLLEREQAILESIQEDINQIEVLPVGFDFDEENNMAEENMNTGSDHEVEEYLTAEEDNEYDLIVQISNVEEAELA